MKKALALLMAFVLLLFASACGKKNESIGDNTEAAPSSSVNSRETAQTDNDADALTENKETTTDAEEGMDAATQENSLATNVSANLDNGDLLQEIESDFERTTSLLKDKLEETYEVVGDSYTDYVNNVHYISEWYAFVQRESEELYARTRTNTENYYRQIFSETNHAQDTDAFEDAMDDYSDRIYDTVFETYYDVIYEGAFEELYEKYYEGILDEQPSGVSFSDYLEVHSGFFSDWLDAHSTFFSDWLDAHSDLFSLYLDVSGAKWDDSFDLEALLEREVIDTIGKEDGESREVELAPEITDRTEEDYYGTWTAVAAFVEGEKYSIKELEEKGDYSSSDYHIIVKKGGLLLIAQKGIISTGESWSFSDGELTAGTAHMVLRNQLEVNKGENSDVIYFEKTAESQIYTINGEKDQYEDDYLFINSALDNGKSIDSSAYYGTWKVIMLRIGNSFMTIKELDYAGNNELEDFYCVFNEEGEAYINTHGNVINGKWEAWSHGIKVGNASLDYYCGYLLMPNNGTTAVFKKISDNQEFSLAAIERGSSISSAPEPAPNLTADGLRPEFKEAMDAYEAFYDEYCEFMKEYKENPTNLSLLGKYADFLEQVDEMDEKFDAWDGDTLNDAEMKYYWEVYNRVMQKLTSVYS